MEGSRAESWEGSIQPQICPGLAEQEDWQARERGRQLGSQSKVKKRKLEGADASDEELVKRPGPAKVPMALPKSVVDSDEEGTGRSHLGKRTMGQSKNRAPPR